jgi:DNA-binding beta-propeller fold protein YncE
VKRKFLFTVCLLIVLLGSVCVSLSAQTTTLLAPQQPLVVPRAPGFFDYMEVDDQYRRLLVSHTSTRTLDIVDLQNDTLARQVEVGEGHGIAVDVKDGRYFVGTSRPQFVVDVQRKYMVKQNQVPMAGPIDAIALDTKSDMVYADRADNGQVVVIDAKSHRIVTNIDVSGQLEFIVYDPVSDRIYQNVTSTGHVAVIDPSTNTVVASWPAAPAQELRGLAVDGTTHRLFSAGGNGKLAEIDTTSGAVVDAADIAPGVDQIAFDPATKRIYCASGTGLLSVVAETNTGVQSLGDVTVPRHAHTVAVDPTSHNVWISYGAVDNDYIMKLVPVVPSPSPSP